MAADPYLLDAYVLDTLMADLVGHDHRPSSFLVYLTLVAAAHRGRVSLSHAELAERTGLSKRGVQMAVAALRQRGLLETRKRHPTEAPEYVPLSPWRR
jgi:transcription initiation factor IIE alpha subunit